MKFITKIKSVLKEANSVIYISFRKICIYLFIRTIYLEFSKVVIFVISP